MYEKYFKDNLPQIKKLLRFAINNSYSDFYRKKYERLKISLENISTYADFQNIPLLTKGEIIATPLKKRIFVSQDKIVRYSFSGGTTEQNKPLVIPVCKTGSLSIASPQMFDEKLKELGIKKVLVLFPPLSGALFSLLSVPKKHVVVIPGDTGKLSLSAKLAREIEIEGIVTTPTILYFFLTELQKIKFNQSSIKWISLGGELCTRQRLEFFKSEFPQARIVFRYGSTEALGLRGYRCDYLYNAEPNIYHPAPAHFLEILDEQSKVVEEGETGEIIETNLFCPAAFPFIRYKTSDIGSLRRERCKCGNEYILKLGGRATYDILKFSGVILHTQAIESSLEEVKEFLEPGFQMHVYEKTAQNRLLPQLLLKVSLKKGYKETAFLKNLVKESVTNRLFLAADKTLKYFVDNNIFLPLEVEFVKEWPSNQAKSKNIISHLS